MDSALGELHANTSSAADFLENAGELSAAVSLRAMHAKTLVIAGASRLEKQVTGAVADHVRANVVAGNTTVIEFVEKKALFRNYHSLFDWDARNANKFFALFGQDFRKNVNETIGQDVNLADCIRSFLELGALRNVLVHGDLLAASLDKTADEVLSLYERADQFAALLPTLLSAGGSLSASPD